MGLLSIFLPRMVLQAANRPQSTGHSNVALIRIHSVPRIAVHLRANIRVISCWFTHGKPEAFFVQRGLLWLSCCHGWLRAARPWRRGWDSHPHHVFRIRNLFILGHARNAENVIWPRCGWLHAGYTELLVLVVRPETLEHSCRAISAAYSSDF